jgi:transcriptional regulator with GAF, ATPase, and Fis domain
MPKRESRSPRRIDWKAALERMARRDIIPIFESLAESNGHKNGNGAQKAADREDVTEDRLGTLESALSDFGVRLARDQERVEVRLSELESERDTFRTLYELSTIIDAERDLHLLVEGVIDALLSLFEVEHILLVLIDESGQVRFSLGKDQSKNRFPAPEDGIHKQVIDSCCGAHTPVHVVGYLDDSEDHASRLALYAVPLMAHDRPLGCVLLSMRAALAGFEKEHRELLGQIALRLALAVERNRRYMQLKASRAKLLEDLRGKFQFDEILGNSPEMTTLLKTAAEVAQTDAAVLVEGESGTGKELLARAIHHNSPRSEEPFVPINCAAIPENLLESELFGYEKGAFTGADKRKIGKFEAADGGTIFLDEIGEMPALLQVKLLRFLQSHEFERLGSTVTRRADVRIISATNRELISLVSENKFREDLYYRINVINLKVPPLRRRRSDIAPLAESFIHKFAKRQGKKMQGLAPEALAILTRYEFPGNIRELENIIERSVILSRGEWVTPAELPELILSAGESRLAPQAAAESYPDLKRRRNEALAEVDRAFVARLLERHKFNISQAAQAAGMHRFELQRLIRKLKRNGSL